MQVYKLSSVYEILRQLKCGNCIVDENMSENNKTTITNIQNICTQEKDTSALDIENYIKW